MVYFDAASGEPLDPAGREAYLAALDEGWAGPDRLYREGRRARMLLDAAREAVAEVLRCRADELVFTGSGTSAVHQGVLGLAKGRTRAGRALVLGAVEHSSVMHAAELAAARNGGERVLVPVDAHGRIRLESLTQSLAGLAVGLVAVQSANHEVGTRQPLREVAELAAGHGVPLLVDAAASLGREPVPPGWSVLAGSARKWGGPTGVGVLAVRKGTRFAADWPQDERERGWSPGPQNVPAILAAATALRARSAEQQEVGLGHRELTELLRARIPELVPDVEVVGDPDDRVPHILTFSCLYASGEALLLELDRAGFSVSSGSSCTASTLTPSHVLEAMGVLSQGNIRVSLPWSARREDVERFLDVLPDAVRAARPEAARDRREEAPASAAASAALEIDALGKLCPLPVIELGKRIGGVEIGGTVRVLADDPAARLDIPAWCRMTGQDFLGAEPLGDERPDAAAYVVKRVR
ncbi:aminotransferase class V-fold PLP-dependent enzyme [Actinospica sp. MGRD01-02]|uniref:Aminotransferase class V-fold PLP-dependent enzyme n=1 Tax=Actinospica acidithermotolerans TaxID=2828514 RepID=A0A941E8L0_9ACTN|nr:cysteine desulfurase/sulfurtransferase TusA family protein [Actinospica acidithermotolerans]MBR7826532.1 aminotransferase class V-fold PLP-dependent enzyme [Actinospica acidithermotolerans]